MTETKTYTGQFGLVFSLDHTTKDAAKIINSRYKGENLINFADGIQEPHITLYHSKLESIPESVIENCMGLLVKCLPLSFSLNKIEPYGGKFLFWNIQKTAELSNAHALALSNLSPYFVSIGEQQADREKISLSQEEQDNVRRFGHPLVGSLWQPHITLGYFPNGVSLESCPEFLNGIITEVMFVRIGEAGTIEEIISRRVVNKDFLL